MTNGYGEMIDVKGSFLIVQFDNNEIIYLEFTELFRDFYPSNVVPLFLCTIYGLKLADKTYWIETMEAI